jgi:CheY-like chemotaxis protein
MGKKILAVDDEDDVLKMLVKRLTNAGYAVVTAQNGKEGIRMAKSEKPDLIVMDINMPEMDGAQAGQILKNDPQTKHIPILYLTCLVTKNEVEKTQNMIGGNYFIAKPYNPEELLMKIKTHLMFSSAS